MKTMKELIEDHKFFKNMIEMNVKAMLSKREEMLAEIAEADSLLAMITGGPLPEETQADVQQEEIVHEAPPVVVQEEIVEEPAAEEPTVEEPVVEDTPPMPLEERTLGTFSAKVDLEDDPDEKIPSLLSGTPPAVQREVPRDMTPEAIAEEAEKEIIEEIENASGDTLEDMIAAARRENPIADEHGIVPKDKQEFPGDLLGLGKPLAQYTTAESAKLLRVRKAKDEALGLTDNDFNGGSIL